MVPELFRVIVPVPNVQEAVTFYQRILGMEGESIADGSRHYFLCGRVILALANPTEHGVEWHPNADHFYFAVADLEEAFERAKKAGCQELDNEIDSRPWGEKSFYARDPFGNPMCFVDEKTKFTGSAT